MYQEMEKFIFYGVSFHMLVQIMLSMKNPLLFAVLNAHQDFSAMYSIIGCIGLGSLPL